MRVTDDRYAGELFRFRLALRMIAHEARTGTIRAVTGFSEDRIRKIFASYFKGRTERQVRRRRGKSPTQVTRLVSSARPQCEATVLACLLVKSQAITLDGQRGAIEKPGIDAAILGERVLTAFEAYLATWPQAGLNLEWTWAVYHALTRDQELYFSSCSGCSIVYLQDAFALDYNRCPFCELKGDTQQL